MKHVQFIKPVILGFCAITIFGACEQERKNTKVKPVVISFKKEGELTLTKAESDSVITKLSIEIADDDYSRQTGLMYRSEMKDDQGMLFIFPNSQYRSFYMKNTQIPLDIIFLSEDMKIVSIQKDARPMDETSLPSDGPATYVLEVNAGLSELWQLEKNDQMYYFEL